MRSAARFAGGAWLAGAAAIWLAGMGTIAFQQGLWAALALMSPFNIAQFAMTVVLFAPGALLLAWGRRA